MKKALVLCGFILPLLLVGCAKNTSDTGTINNSSSGESVTIKPAEYHFSLESQYSYNRDMGVPTVASLGNFESISKGYEETKKITHTITQSEMNTVSKQLDFEGESCKNGTVDIMAKDLRIKIGEIKYADMKAGKNIDLSVPYKGDGLKLSFSSQQKEDLDKKGWIVMEANSGMLTQIKGMISYEEDSIEPYTPEWVEYMRMIGGVEVPQRRYPYNTVYISSDLLLHSFHKLFSNSMKEYESTIARNQIGSIIDQSLNTFAALAKSSSSELKPYYDYLVAYRSVAKILLPNQKEMDLLLTMPMDSKSQEQRYENMNGSDMKNEYLKMVIQKRVDEITKQYSTAYNDAVKDSVAHILAGSEQLELDYLGEAFSPQTDPEFIIKQDYTQFVPRGYYTDNSYLKTYFMSMKWLMKHKMYARDSKLTQASLIMAHNFPKSADQTLAKMQEFVHTMIGGDDDVTAGDLQKFLSSKSIKKDSDIIKNYSTDWQKEIAAIRPQKIISTHYATPEEEAVSEEEAKNMTAGFIFFGEKFTPDAWIMDQLSAGSAEKESVIKPEVVSIYHIWDTIMGGGRSTYADQWLQTNKTKFDITNKQLDSYGSLRDQTNKLLAANTDTSTIYNKWIQLSQLATVTPKNPPKYMQDKSFENKTYNTLIGTYNELKHDTILYVKQPTAEMGGGGGGGCFLHVEVPALPVPKGYVEPQIDLMDRLISLSDETSNFFGGVNKDNYKIFKDYVTFVKKIAVAETQNSEISDEDFEKLRLSFPILQQIMSPSATYIANGDKGTRASIIADIFTSGTYGPYYVANGRPLIMVVSIDDVNGKRAVLGPVYSTYEFYGTPIPSKAGRYTDSDWRAGYDALTGKNSLMTLPLQHIISK